MIGFDEARPPVPERKASCRFLKIILLVASLAALAALLFAMPRHADATIKLSFDPAVHPFVQLATTDKGVHAPGGLGNVLITLRNPRASAFAATVVTSITFNTTLIEQVTSRTTVEALATASIKVPFIIRDRNERGYRVGISVRNSSGAVVDNATTAIDVQTSLIHSRFPRQCWVSHWDKGVDTTALIASQVAWYCNSVQGYALYYRPELAPPPSLSSWSSLSNLTISRATIENVIAAAHEANMPVGFFQATGEAYSNWPSQLVKPSLSWGSFRNRCGLSSNCTADDMDQSPPRPGNWTQYGWQADHLDFFDPCAAGWQEFLISKSIRPMMEQFAFDFWQADTVGKPVQPTYDIKGRSLDTARCLSAFTTGVRKRLGKPAVLNNVSGWGLDDTARAGGQPYLYRETWNFDTPYYPGLNALISGSPKGVRRHTTRAIVQPAYINRTLAEKCLIRARTSGCTVNPNTALLATAMFAIAGSTWMNHHDDGCVMTNVFVEGYHLPCSASLVSNLLEYKAFEVGYQNLLRDGVKDSTEACTVSDARAGTIGAAGQIYVLGKIRPGFQMCHLLNLTGVSSNDWTDLEGTKEKPTPHINIAMKLYYAGDAVVNGVSRLWWASPDHAAGAAQSLRYTTGSDGTGHYVSFTLPRLSYWDMIVLER